MRKYSIEVIVNILSNKSVIVSIEREIVKEYIKNLNQYQSTPISYYSTEKRYSHKSNNDLLLAIINYFDERKVKMIIFNEDDNIKSLGDFEILLLNRNKEITLNHFENSKALQYLQDNNLLNSFLQKKLKANIVDYYSEYSKQFGERINIKSEESDIITLDQIEQYLNNNMIVNEYKSTYIYSCSRKSKLISFSIDKKHIIVNDGKKWLEDLLIKNEGKMSGFPFAQGKVINSNVYQLVKMIK